MPLCLQLRRLRPARLLALPAVFWLLLAAEFASAQAAGQQYQSALHQPKIFPDYRGVTMPPNIAPLNFRIEESATRYRVELHSTRGEPILLSSRTAAIKIPIKPWRTLLRENRGEPLLCEVSLQLAASTWTRYATITNYIADQEIDGYLVYRLLKPLYNAYVHLGIYQRNLETFEQRPVLENDKFGGGCINCHTPLNRSPETFAFNIRGTSNNPPMMLVVSNQVIRVEKTMGYLSWHPTGRLLAFSVNKLSLFSHTIGETRDVYDAGSDLAIYRVDSNTVVSPPAISSPDRNETWPAWSADGRYLYYCSAMPFPLRQFRHVRYDLMRVPYNIDADQWGQPETLVSSQETALSACQPKPSPDGRFLLFTMCKYGNFPIYRPDSDLYLMDLRTKTYRRLEINSDQADSWHSWSSNSRWVVFSSKRLDGLFARPHISYVDEQGQFHKPFLLPQEDPSFYDSCLNTFNVPELMSGPVKVKDTDLGRAILKPLKVLVPEGNPPTSPTSPAPDSSQMRE